MPYRKVKMENDSLYHIYCRSIAGYKIYNSSNDYNRFINAALYYNNDNKPMSLSRYLNQNTNNELLYNCDITSGKYVDICAFCVMPTHFHFILKQLSDDGISKFMMRLMQCYSQYFNLKYKRKGPLWDDRFHNIHINTEEYLLHLTRYIHSNPVKKELAINSVDWPYSSYKEYIKDSTVKIVPGYFLNNLDLTPNEYKIFANEEIDEQKELTILKDLIFIDD